jgi:hypothetical protein
MLSAAALSSDTLLRIVGLVNDARARRAVRETCASWRDAVRLWEGTAPQRLFQVVRLYPGTCRDLAATHGDPPSCAGERVYHLRCGMRPELMRGMQTARDKLMGTLGFEPVFEAAAHEWDALVRLLLCSPLPWPMIARWGLTCALPMRDASSSSSSSGHDDVAALCQRLRGLSRLERVHLRLYVPHMGGRQTLGGATAFLREALPAWGRLTHLTLTDLSFVNRGNGVELVHTLAMALVRDASTVESLLQMEWTQEAEGATRWLHRALAEASARSPLHVLRLERVWLENDPLTLSLFWLLLGAFPVRRSVELVSTHIRWPAPSIANPRTGTIFTEAFYAASDDEDALVLDLEHNCPARDANTTWRSFERSRGDDPCVRLKLY